MSRNWFITGINSGFGKEVTRQLLERGERVYGTVRNTAGIADLQHAYGDLLTIGTLDVTDTDAVKTTVQQAFARLGRIDVIFNNAGYGLFGVAEGLSSEQIRKQLDTNLLAPIEVARAALPFMRAQGGGHMLAMSTYGGQATHPGASLYHASKWGLEGFFESLAAEVAPFNIAVTIVEPGGARTAFRSAAASNAGALPEAYLSLPVGALLARLGDASFVANGDPTKMARRIIEAINEPNPPRRLVLGSDAFRMIHQALTARLQALHGQEALASSTDYNTPA
ncbi:short-chain dehydrogenase/reductase [Azorhizobium oxalatiphilum]|uniref:Short-chain dehydrogenase/reductase n=1 Tax=Azorhizobium oxalatiphilum TaxID=980631 RepID=A0A917CF92_9HYPH|nr:SDR family oxidoreductase [Azorhizobium oxalatiphilum]GGF85679.1 short-chain dehydrogenase/reductase [Azorhizobium oxalatiphilum]